MINPLISIIQEDVNDILSSVDLRDLSHKSVLITGASGLLGVYFMACLKTLSDHGSGAHNVTAIVHSKLPDYFKYFFEFPGVTVIQGDLSDDNFIRSFGHFDYVIHAAGYGQPGRFMENPLKTIALNTNVTMSLFHHLNDGGHYLFLSTSEVYSGLPHPPYHEDQIGTSNTDHPRACYIEAKRCGEAICHIQRQRGIHASAARLSLAYGPGTKRGDRRVINSFIERGIQNHQISLQDMGTALRTYCYVADAVEILWHILLCGTQSIYNVGGESRTTIADLARNIGEILDVPIIFPQKAIVLDGAPDDVRLDMSRVHDEFHKQHYVDLNDGLRRTVYWQQSLYSSNFNDNS